MSIAHFQRIKLAYVTNSAILFESFSSQHHSIFLDSCSDRRKESGVDVIAAAPYLQFIAQNDIYQIYDATHNLVEQGQSALSRLLQLKENEDGSLLGYFGYHCNDVYFQIEKKETVLDEEMPDICLGFYAWRIEINHIEKTCELKYLPNKFKDDDLKILIEKLNSFTNNNKKQNIKQSPASVSASSNLTKENYLKAFKKIKSYIKAGDCYQVNLAQRFTLPFANNTWQHYLYLRTVSPAPYACYFTTAFGDVLSFSPESFLEINTTGKIISQPIKGTRKRHIEVALDQQAAQELANSEKDKAENLMIVDLIRNDLSKNALLNSVKVDKLFDIQSFANVHHMVSQISAHKISIKSHLDVLFDCFPGGSITGAPKKRAMEIIKELEPHNRQVYCGAIGQIDFEGNMLFNIAIRTLVIKKGMLYCWGGGGLVADSNAEEEYQESITKISNLIPI